MDENKDKPHCYLPEKTICRLVDGDSEALTEALRFYDGYASYLLDYVLTHYHISKWIAPREDMMQEIRLELFKAMKKFK